MTTPDNAISIHQLCECAQNGSHANKPTNGCEFCQTLGLPIFPVRYAVTATSGSRLPKVAPPPALAATGLEQHHYTLRLMRTGYLYLYDEANDRCAGWFITSDAKFFHYALRDTDENGLPCLVSNIRSDENKNTLLSCNDKSHHLPASMIRWPLKGCSRLWVTYSELPIPTKELQSLVKQGEWRTANMQPVDAQAWAGGQYSQENAFVGTQIGQSLAEANATEGTTYDCHPYYPDPQLGKGVALQKSLTEFFAQYYQKNSQQGLVLALQDNIAVIETLNHDRHRPERMLQSAIGNPDRELREVNAKDYERRRQLQCYCLLNILNDNEAQKGQQEIDSYNKRYNSPTERRKMAIESIPPQAMSGIAFKQTVDAFEKSLPTPERNAATVHGQVKERQETIYKNLSEYVDIDAFQDFKCYYETAVATRDNDVLVMDKDYASFAAVHLQKIMRSFAWLSNYPVLAVSFISLLFRCVQGNIMTPASADLWDKHLLPSDSVGIVIKTLSLQDDKHAEKLVKKFTAAEHDFTDQLVKSKNIQKVLKEAQKVLDGLIKKLSKQANAAVMLLEYRAPSASSQAPHVWRYACVRTLNILRLANNEPLYVAVKVTLPRSEGVNFLLSLPEEISANPESLSPKMKEIAINQDSEGKITRVSNKPINQVSPSANQEKLTLTLLVTEQDTKEFTSPSSGNVYDATPDPHTGVYSVNIEGRIEHINVTASRLSRLKKGFVAVIRAEAKYPAASASIGMLFSLYAFIEAFRKNDKTSKDWVALTSSALGIIKSGITWRDAVINTSDAPENVKKLLLWGEKTWVKNIGHCVNALGVITTLYDLDQAIQTQRNGESTRVVTAAYASAGLTAIGTYFMFLPLPFGIGQIVSVLCIVLGALIAWWGAQTLTLEQRMWFRRCIFGLPGSYYENEHFGGKAPSAHAPEDVRLSYHKNALNDEMLALSLLVQGVKLEIGYIGLLSPKKLGRAVINAAAPTVAIYNSINPDNTSSVTLKVTLPSSLDCIIDLNVQPKNPEGNGILGPNKYQHVTYAKTGNKVVNYKALDASRIDIKAPEYEVDDNAVIIEITQEVELNKPYPVTLSISDIQDVYNVIAKDTHIINASR